MQSKLILIHANLSRFSSCFRRKHFRLKYFNFWNRINSTHALHCVLIVAWHIFIRVDATTEVAYELVAEPIQEPQAGEQ